MKRTGLFKKGLALIIAAACTVTFIPQVAFADELVLDDEVIPVEETANEAADTIADLDYADVEPDGAVDPVLQNAKAIKLSTTVNGTATEENKAYYKFTPEKTGRYELTGSSDDKMTVRVFDGDKYVERRTDGCYYWHRQSTTVLDDTGDQGNKVDLIGGKTCYIVVENDSTSSEISFNFTINLKYEVTKSLKSEPTEVKFDKEYEGHLCADFHNSENYTFDANKNYYKFSLKEPGTFTFHIGDDSTKASEHTKYTICNDLDDYLASSDRVNHMSWQWNTHKQNEYGGPASHNCWLKTDDGSDEARLSLLAGDYYIFIWSSLSSGNDKALNYTLKLKDFKALKASKNETLLVDEKLNGDNAKDDYTLKGYGQYYENHDMPVIETNKAYRGILTEDSKNDYYHFTLAKNGPLFLTLESDDCIGNCYVTLRYWSKDLAKWGTTEVIMKGDTYKATPGNPLNSVQLMNSYYEDPSIVYKKSKPEFMAGEYVIGISTQVYRDESNKIFLGESGQYKFKISTNSSTDAMVSGVKIVDPDQNNKAVSTYEMTKNYKKTFAAVVSPDKAEKEVIWSIDNTSVAEINPTTGEVTSKSAGNATITVTTTGRKKDGSPATATCKLTVLDEEINDFTKELKDEANVVSNEKIVLTGEEYFGPDFKTDKTDKWIVKDADTDKVDKKLGSVKKDSKLGWVFVGGKKDGNVKVTRQTKIGKTYVNNGSITFKIELPKYFKDGKKDIKTKDVAKRGVEVNPTEMINYDGATVLPNYFACNDKKGNVEFDPDTGKLTVLKSGTFKVTAYYGADVEAAKSTDKNISKNAFKNAGKIEYTIKAKLPTVKDLKVKPNKPGDKAKNKSVTVTVSNISKDVSSKLTADSWKIYKASVDETGKQSYDKTQIPDADKIIFQPGVKGNFTKALVEVAPGTEAQLIAVVVTIDDVEYPAYITIQEVK